MYEAFLRYDADKSGVLDLEEVQNLLVEFGLMPKSKADRDRVEMLFDALDADGGGELDFLELLGFIREIRLQAAAEKREELRAWFESYDRDKSGDLSMREI